MIQFSTQSIDENSTGEVGTLSSDNPAVVSFKIDGDPEVLSTFEIQGDKIVVQDGQELDYETFTAYSFVITAIDANGNEIEQALVPLQIDNVDEAPVVSSTAAGATEGVGEGEVVATVTASDPEGQPLTYTLDSAWAGIFELALNQDGSAYEIKVAAGVTLDRENEAHRSVIVNVSDGTNTVPHTIDLGLADVNDTPPSNLVLSNTTIDEDAAAGDVVGTLQAVDPDLTGVFSYAIVDANGDPVDDDLFEIAGNQVVVKAGAALDADTVSSHTIKVKVSDGLASSIQDIQITIGDVNDNAPTGLTLSSAAVDENTPVGSVVGTLSATDADGVGTYTYTIVDANDGPVDDSLFEIVGNEVRVKAELDADIGGTHMIRVKVSDGLNPPVVQDVTITINDLNDSGPTGLSLSTVAVSESAAVGDVVGILSATDPDSVGTHTYTIVDSNGAPVEDSLFEIVGNEVRVKAGLDADIAGSHTIKVMASDGVNPPYVQDVAIAITDVNDSAPTDVSLSTATVAEDVAVGAVVGTLSAADADTVGTLTYTIVDANGDPVADDLFEIIGDEVRVKGALDHEAAGTHTIRVQVSDGVNPALEKDVTITIGDVDDTAPKDIVLTFGGKVPENAPSGAIINVLSAFDPDTAGPLSYCIVDASGNPVVDDLFDIVQGDHLVLKGELDYETATSHTIKVKVSDGVNSSIQDVTIQVGNVNDNAPTGLALSSTAIDEDAAVGDVVGTLSATDADAGSTLTYTLVDANGAPVEDSLFEIVGTEVRVKAGLDHEAAGTHTIRVKVSDGLNSQAQDIQITIGDVNEAPIGGGNSVAVTEGAGEGTVVGVITATDPEDQELTYSLDAASDEVFDLVAIQGGAAYEIRVASGVTLDYENPAHRTVTVSVSDGVNSTGATLDIDLADANDNAPTGLALSSTTIAENAAAGDVVGTLSATDADTVGTYTYAIVDSTGAPVEDSLFEIVGDEVRVKAGLDADSVSARTPSGCRSPTVSTIRSKRISRSPSTTRTTALLQAWRFRATSSKRMRLSGRWSAP